jgi:hypothetical protein
VGTVRRIMSFALFVGLIGMVGCGSDSNTNDQGVSFRAVGLFSGDLSESKCTVPTTSKAISDQGTSLPLNDPRLNFGYPNNTTDTFFVCQGYIWLQNDLVNQAIVVDSIDFEYEIPHTPPIPIPSEHAPTGIRIYPSNADPATHQNPSGQVNVYIGQLTGQLIPAHLIASLRQMNQESKLPPLPFVMNISVTARGRTDNGAGIVSNETRYTFEFTKDIPSDLTLVPTDATLSPGSSFIFILTGGTTPYHIFPYGGVVDKDVVTTSGDFFTYTAGNSPGVFSIFVEDSNGSVRVATVTIQ